MFQAPDRVELKSARWVTLGIHGMFLILLVLGVIRADSAGALFGGIVIAGWYVAGIFLRRTRSSTFAAVWVIGLGVVWAIATLAVAADFVWLAFPLFFLLLFLLPAPVSVLSVVIVTVVAIIGLDGDGNLEVGEIVGPTIGAGVAVVFTLAYRALATEHRRTRQLLAELVETRGRLSAAEREKGGLEERRRIAREVHDTIAQGLSSIVLLAHAAALSSPDDQAAMGQIGEIAKENLQEARRIVMALNPHDLDGGPLSVAVERAAQATGEGSGIDVDFHLVGEPVVLPVAQELTLLRVAQGALANARAHSGASRVQVTLSFLSDRTTLDVVDDGIGFDPSAGMPEADDSGFGLEVMRHRLDAVDGTLTIETGANEGTAVVASIPWSES